MKTTKRSNINKLKCKCRPAYPTNYTINILDKKLDTKSKQYRYLLQCVLCNTKWRYYTTLLQPITDINVNLLF